jgi:hypothetical protein
MTLFINRILEVKYPMANIWLRNLSEDKRLQLAFKSFREALKNHRIGVIVNVRYVLLNILVEESMTSVGNFIKQIVDISPRPRDTGAPHREIKSSFAPNPLQLPESAVRKCRSRPARCWSAV